jgi:hypothetical protein
MSDSVRDEFEKWAESEYGCVREDGDFDRDIERNYVDYYLQRSWEGWEARERIARVKLSQINAQLQVANLLTAKDATP